MTPFVWGLLFAALGALLVLATRQGTPLAAALGFAVSLALVVGFGPGALAPLALFVLGSGVLTRLGRARKERLRAAQKDRGRRGAANVAAKLAIPALLGLAAAAVSELRAIFGLGVAAALAAAFADTAATETGPLSGGPVVRWGGGGFQRAPHGTPGGMSAAGLLAGATAAVALALLARVVHLGPERGAPWSAAGAGFGAALVESAVAGTAWGRRAGPIGRNLFLSALAAAAGCLIAVRTSQGG